MPLLNIDEHLLINVDKEVSVQDHLAQMCKYMIE